MRFQGTKNYIASDDLKLAVDAALNLEKPLLVKGEPGTGKTELARQISKSLNSNMLYGIEIEKNGWPVVCCPISLISIKENSDVPAYNFLTSFALIYFFTILKII